jgi:hypothetical protein
MTAHGSWGILVWGLIPRSRAGREGSVTQDCALGVLAGLSYFWWALDSWTWTISLGGRPCGRRGGGFVPLIHCSSSLSHCCILQRCDPFCSGLLNSIIPKGDKQTSSKVVHSELRAQSRSLNSGCCHIWSLLISEWVFGARDQAPPVFPLTAVLCRVKILLEE